MQLSVLREGNDMVLKVEAIQFGLDRGVFQFPSQRGSCRTHLVVWERIIWRTVRQSVIRSIIRASIGS